MLLSLLLLLLLRLLRLLLLLPLLLPNNTAHQPWHSGMRLSKRSRRCHGREERHEREAHTIHPPDRIVLSGRSRS